MSTIVADTSVFVAIFKTESIAAELRDRIARSQRILVPSICLVELALLRRVDDNMFGWASELVGRRPYELVETSVGDSSLAAAAARHYGKGSGHPAQLNFGDCLVYAAAKTRDLPLLFTGSDFARTDLVAALQPK